MISAKISSLVRSAGKSALLALGCAFSLVLLQVPAARAADATTMQPLADKLPLTGTFEKGPAGENGPYTLKLTNTSTSSLKVSAKVLLSVAFHADNKARVIPEHTIDAGQSWSISDLAAADKVIVTAAGYAPLELVVP